MGEKEKWRKDLEISSSLVEGRRGGSSLDDGRTGKKRKKWETEQRLSGREAGTE